MGRSWPTLITASWLLSVTIVGLETTLVLCSVCSALRTSVKSVAEKTAVSERAVAPPFATEFRKLTALLAVFVRALFVPLLLVVVEVESRLPVVPVVEVAVVRPLDDVTVALLFAPLVCVFVVPLLVSDVVPLVLLTFVPL